MSVITTIKNYATSLPADSIWMKACLSLPVVSNLMLELQLWAVDRADQNWSGRVRVLKDSMAIWGNVQRVVLIFAVVLSVYISPFLTLGAVGLFSVLQVHQFIVLQRCRENKS